MIGKQGTDSGFCPVHRQGKTACLFIQHKVLHPNAPKFC
ncbi:Uncharacterised protein [Escherichia coli]|uniref:Uncharacterized protein n=1 Tax=Escherichia coli TaxID=562 RepID=A0A377F518_ECOLX|nr:Uncharacterised protein [Escherichia coli]